MPYFIYGWIEVKSSFKAAAGLQTVSCWLKIHALLSGFSPSLPVTHTVMVRAFYKPPRGSLASVNHKVFAITEVFAVADDPACSPRLFLPRRAFKEPGPDKCCQMQRHTTRARTCEAWTVYCVNILKITLLNYVRTISVWLKQERHQATKPTLVAWVCFENSHRFQTAHY